MTSGALRCGISFPRSADRGPIEGRRVSLSASIAQSNFRDQLIAAQLKAFGLHLLFVAGDHFRDQLIAAQLKVCVAGGSSGGVLDFRDQLIAAQLKASRSIGRFASGAAFPRSADRGPIEGQQVQVLYRASTYFPDQLIAAQLKRSPAQACW